MFCFPRDNREEAIRITGCALDNDKIGQLQEVP